VRFAVVVPRFAGPHTGAFDEVAETVHYALLALGHDSMQSSNPVEGRRSILFGPGLYRFAPPRDAILYNLEQSTAPGVSRLASRFARFTLWDYSPNNVEFWNTGAGNGIRRIRPAIHVPIGYVPELTRIERREPTSDVLFYGLTVGPGGPRRLAALDAIRANGLRVDALAFGTYGRDRDEAIARTKLVVNVNYYQPAIFQIVRVSYLLANKVAVVSEDGIEGEAFRGAVHFASYEGLADACARLARDDEAREALASAGHALVKTLDARVYVREALAQS
jgi:hypothetical protein